jgi:hypothetical protein
MTEVCRYLAACPCGVQVGGRGSGCGISSQVAGRRQGQRGRGWTADCRGGGGVFVGVLLAAIPPRRRLLGSLRSAAGAAVAWLAGSIGGGVDIAGEGDGGGVRRQGDLSRSPSVCTRDRRRETHL